MNKSELFPLCLTARNSNSIAPSETANSQDVAIIQDAELVSDEDEVKENIDLLGWLSFVVQIKFQDVFREFILFLSKVLVQSSILSGFFPNYVCFCLCLSNYR